MKSRSESTPTESAARPDHRRRRSPSGPSVQSKPLSTAQNGTGQHRAAAASPRREPTAEPAQPPTRYEPYLDGLFTYCLSVLCEHEAAAAALDDVLELARRHGPRLRDPAQLRPWLYALARHACLQRLSASGGRNCGPDRGPEHGDAAAVPDEVARQRRAELAALAWPEAAGTAPDQREALELAVRHGLPAHEVAAVLGLEPPQARSLLSRAACEVERTRAALAVVEVGSCPVLARLGGDTQVLLGTALRRELVRHVDDCPECRATAERAMAAGSWPGTATPAVLAVIQAPRPGAPGATAGTGSRPCARADKPRAGKPGKQRKPRAARSKRPAAPRFDRRGFPMDVKDRAARRELLRHRAVTTTVVAAVVAAPALALVAAYRGGQQEAAASRSAAASASASSATRGALPDWSLTYRGSGSDQAGSQGRVGVRSPGGLGGPGRSSAGEGTAGKGASPSPSASRPGGGVHQTGTVRPERRSPGRLIVSAHSRGDDTVVTLRASGGSPVGWHASSRTTWLVLSRTSGVLRPGETTTVTISVDRRREPSGSWRARVVFQPSDAVVTVEGTGPSPSSSPSSSPTDAPSRAPAPSGSEEASASPTASQSQS